MEDDNNEPSVWLPACITQVEKLAADCKLLASKVNSIWTKETSGTEQSNSLDKAKVLSCCRQLRRAVATAQSNMKMVEKKIVRKYTRTYGSAADIDIDSDSDSESESYSNSNALSPQRLVLKIKNFREANRKQDYYAEIRGSPNLTEVCKDVRQTGNDKTATSEMSDALERNNLNLVDDETEPYNDTSSEKSITSAATEKQINTLQSDSCEWNPLSLLETESNAVNSKEMALDKSSPDHSCSKPSAEPDSDKLGASSQSAKSKDKATKLKSEKHLDKNESARRNLLNDSSSDSDDSLIDVKVLSPRFKRTSKRNQRRVAKSDEVTLNSECAVGLDKIEAVSCCLMYHKWKFDLIDRLFLYV